MDLGVVMQEIADRLDTIPGLRVHGHPPDAINPPAAVVTYPESLTYDVTYGRGMDTMNPSVVALVGNVETRTARDRIAKYCAGSGPESFKAVLESGEYTELQVIRVESIQFDIIAIGRVEYLAATFALYVAGQGA